MEPVRPFDRGKHSSRYILRSSSHHKYDDFPPLNQQKKPTSTVGKGADTTSNQTNATVNFHSEPPSLKESPSPATSATPADHLQPPPTPTNPSVGGGGPTAVGGSPPPGANSYCSVQKPPLSTMNGGGGSGDSFFPGDANPFQSPGSQVTSVSVDVVMDSCEKNNNGEPNDEVDSHTVTNELKKIDTAEEATNSLDYQATSPKSHEPKSFADIFKDAGNIHSKGKLRFIPPVLTEIGTKHAHIPDELLVKQNEKWLLTLVGCFIGKRPAFQFVKFHAFRLWKKYGLIDVILNDRGFFYFKFDNELGMQKVLEMRPWLFNDIPVLLKKWEVGIEFDKIRPTSVPLWVNFYDLAPVMWDYEVLSHIVSVLGVPVAIDRYTEEMCEKNSGRAAFARVLLRVNADQDLPPFVEAVVMGQMKKFRVQYFWKPDRCSYCNTFGHKFIDCTDRPRSAEVMEARMTTTDPANEANQNEGNQDFQLPKRRRRRPKKAEITGVTRIPKQYSPKKPEKLEDPKSSAMDPPPLDTTSPDTQSSTHIPVHLGIPTSPTSPDPVADADTTDPVADADTVAPEPLSSSSRPNYVGTSTNAESDSDKIWRYRDTTGNIHGPFSLAQLLKWSEEGYFPYDHKIWRISSTEKESMLLLHVLERRAIHISATNGSDNQKTGGSLKFSDGG